jgi:putative endonuclease
MQSKKTPLLRAFFKADITDAPCRFNKDCARPPVAAALSPTAVAQKTRIERCRKGFVNREGWFGRRTSRAVGRKRGESPVLRQCLPAPAVSGDSLPPAARHAGSQRLPGIHSVTSRGGHQQTSTLLLPMGGFVYILASKKGGTLYTGVTADLARRVWEHKQRAKRSFTDRYGVLRLVWYQEYVDIGEAIVFEKRIKKWRRAWKVRMIEEMNPDWRELYGGLGW